MSFVRSQHRNFSPHWEVVPFDEAFDDLTGGNAKVQTRYYLRDGVLPVIDQGQAPIAGYVNDPALACKAPLPCILFGDHTRVFKYATTPFALGADGVKVLSPRRGLDARFAFHYLQTVRLPEDLGYSRHFKHLREANIPRPPIREQRRIADILDKADAIRRKRHSAIALTEELLRSTFLEMVGPGAADYTQWPARTIASLAANTSNAMRTGPFGSDLRHSEFVDEGIAVLGIDNAVHNRFAWGERRFITPAKYDTLRRYTVKPGDVIITIMGTTGRSAVVPDEVPTAITTKHLATITLDLDEAEPEFVSQALFRHPEVLRQIHAANRGAIMSGLNLGLIKALRIPVPPLARQREFARATTRIRTLAKRMEDHEHAEELFQSLMARAFSGQLHASEAPC